MEQVIQTKVLRLALAISFAMLVSYLIAWPVYFITPLFVAVILSSDLPKLTIGLSEQFVVLSAVLILLGVMVAEYLLPYPVICFITIFVLLVCGHYASVSGQPSILVVMLFIGILMMPLMAMDSVVLMHTLASGLLVSLTVAVFICMLFYAFMPIEHSRFAKQTPELGSPQSRFNMALLKGVLCLPVLLVFYLFQLSSDLLVLIFVALLIQMPSSAVGIKGATAMLLANVMGGVIAIVMYQAIAIVPNLFFVVVCTFVAMVAFGRRLFSDSPYAALYGTGINTVLVLIGGATGAGADDAGDKLALRLLQIFVAVVYMIVALNLVEKLLNKLQRDMQPNTP